MFRRLAVLALPSLLLTGFHPCSFAQVVTTSDPQAVQYAATSLAALTGGVALSDVTLSGSVTWNGSDKGTVTLKALGAGESRIDLALESGVRTEIRDIQTGTPIGQWTTPKASGSFAFHNCQTDAVWFFPALGSLNATANTVFSYVGQETRDGIAIQHIRSYALTDPVIKSGSIPLSMMDIYLDATTLLPVAIAFEAHPDNDEIASMQVEIRFSNYQTINEASVPMHLQRYQQGVLLVDLVLTNASFNSGMSLSTFAIN